MIGKPGTAEKSLLIPIMLISALGIILHFWYGMILGPADHKIYIRCFLSAMMYFSTIKYVYDYYCKGVAAKIYGLLIRYSVSVAGTLLSLYRYSSASSYTDALFVLIVVVIMLVPYVTGNLAHAKHNVPLVIIIAVLVTAIAALKLSMPDIPKPLLAYGEWGIFTERFNEVSQTVQWYSFTIIYLLRWQECKKRGIAYEAAVKEI